MYVPARTAQDSGELLIILVNFLFNIIMMNFVFSCSPQVFFVFRTCSRAELLLGRFYPSKRVVKQ